MYYLLIYVNIFVNIIEDKKIWLLVKILPKNSYIEYNSAKIGRLSKDWKVKIAEKSKFLPKVITETSRCQTKFNEESIIISRQKIKCLLLLSLLCYKSYSI